MLKPITVNEFLHRKKVPVTIDPEKDYALVTVKLYHKGVILREKKKGSLLGSKMYRVSEGDFILSGIDARNGAFGIVPKELDGAIVTNDFWYFDIDETKVKRDFFYWLTTTPLFLDACQKSSKGETQRIRLQSDPFFNFEFHFPQLEKQEEFLNSFQKIDSTLAALGNEQESQSSYLSQLRQAILQEAIEGKLTADWRKKNPINHELTQINTNKKKDISVHSCSFVVDNLDFAPASVLLEKIKEEKEALAKRAKKEKELPPIKPEEVPFELPEGWVWTRLGEVSNSILGKMLDNAKNQGKLYPYLRNLNVRWFEFDLSDLKEIKLKENELMKYSAIKGDLLICEGGYPGRGAIWNHDYPIIIQKAIHRVRFVIQSHNIWLLYYLQLLDMNRNIENYFTGSGIKHLTGIKLKMMEFPLPPLAEQQAIVERVDRLIAIVDNLEKQVAERKVQASELMQAVLREAFEG